MLWPWVETSGQRFVFPVLPFLFYYFCSGISSFGSVMAQKVMYCAVMIVILLNLFMPIRYLTIEYDQDPSELVNYSERISRL